MASIEHRNVVEAEEAALENVVAFIVNLVDPPGKVNQQFMKASFKKLAIGYPRANPIHVVNSPDGPRMNGWIQVRKLPFISRNLTVRMLELFKEQQPQLLFC